MKDVSEHLKGLTGDAYQCAAKEYHALLHIKKREYVLHKEFSDAHAMARNPKRVWNEIKGHTDKVVGNFTKEDMFMYVHNLYNIPRAQGMMHGPHESTEDRECFSLEEVKQALTKMHSCKTGDSSGIYTKMLKWLSTEALACHRDLEPCIPLWFPQ